MRYYAIHSVMQEWSQNIVTAEIQKGSSSLTVQKAISLSWKLATMIVTTDYSTFDERIHEQIARGSNVNIPKGMFDPFCTGAVKVTSWRMVLSLKNV